MMLGWGFFTFTCCRYGASLPNLYSAWAINSTCQRRKDKSSRNLIIPLLSPSFVREHWHKIRKWHGQLLVWVNLLSQMWNGHCDAYQAIALIASSWQQLRSLITQTFAEMLKWKSFTTNGFKCPSIFKATHPSIYVFNHCLITIKSSWESETVQQISYLKRTWKPIAGFAHIL